MYVRLEAHVRHGGCRGKRKQQLIQGKNINPQSQKWLATPGQRLHEGLPACEQQPKWERAQ